MRIIHGESIHNGANEISSGKPIKFGRGATNEIVIHDPTSCVSSSHGQIEFRGGIVEVVDTSRNGIYVVFDGEQPFRVNSRLALHSSGLMMLGRRPEDPRRFLSTSLSSRVP